jgi:hypothetical protein
MPILQKKLVWQSIEALYDEAFATMPDAAIDIGIIKSRPAAILQQTGAEQTPLKTAGGDDVMARIDHLLGKLDEEDDAATAQSAPAANDQSASTEIADEATTTVTQADDANAIVAASVAAPDDAAADMRDDDPARSELVDDDPVQDETVQNDPVQALNNIAAAIHQAQQNQIDSDAPTADPDLTPALDMAVLSATIADEVRNSVSMMIAAEMPQMVRQAVVEAIREMPTAAPDQPQPKAAKKTRAKPGTAKKPPAKKTAANKTAANKKAVTKRATAKKAAS